ncbi:SDR family NAD(P)-dependent oxidoreductase [Deinococcus humi]|uniref:NADP-dependent 3-hydroxy acid dehydrogenase YdfG n=1 Tax=Deinococcus humi TaxID=662880 RepID=A0A7W8JXZ4_9DEIO|nr:SDR family NAD(P)-dependent oxidoreductase [Deinococcus humi]MBB5364913.1 NADP-dependent 3-hydroxy acid dehydrogenase YdfG [Deinococcus humi]GGO33683.1 oxidoreductase [Deinococcus humi]
MTQQNSKLAGKVALVTGASSGIGEATALALAEHGAAVALVARRKERLDELAGRIEGMGGKVAVIVSDLAQAGQGAAVVQQTLEALGRLDIVVNNAGVMLLGPVAGGDPSDLQRMMDLNVTALMHLSQAALETMKPQRSGHIVNISSVSGRGASPLSAGYSASKWAVGGFSEGLRQEAKQDRIRVTVIEPGVVATELTDHITHTQTKDAYEGRIKDMEALQSEDIAAAVVYAVTQPERVNVNELLIRPLDQG